jgi:hypothetical protein
MNEQDAQFHFPTLEINQYFQIPMSAQAPEISDLKSLGSGLYAAASRYNRVVDVSISDVLQFLPFLFKFPNPQNNQTLKLGSKFK